VRVIDAGSQQDVVVRDAREQLERVAAAWI
jgi:hypothetical protein